MGYKFHNPYNFVSTPTRDLDHDFCGDHDPSDLRHMEDHSRYWARRYSGTVPVVLKTQTPLFITDPDSERKIGGKDSGHYCYDCMDHIPATALKGMLSSAYEIITNSRFRVFNKKQHGKRLSYRERFSRKLSAASPLECLDPSLCPAEEKSRLSPADRLFGWVAQERPPSGISAWRGKVRISGGDFFPNGEFSEPVKMFPKPIALSILGAPKPEQARFYLGDNDGLPQKQGRSKDDVTYKKGKKLRGRKVYLHHTLHFLSSKEQKKLYWMPGEKGIDVREYERFTKNMANNHRTNQNRSITGWIPKGCEFRFSISFANLTVEELGALLTLLSLSLEQCYFRLGFAKPLGLGSVALRIEWDGAESIPVCTGDDMSSRYRKLGEFTLPHLSKADANRMIRAYQKAMVSAYGRVEDLDEGEKLSDLPWERDKKRYEFLLELANEAEIKDLADAWISSLGTLDAMKKIPKDPRPALDGLTWIDVFAEDPEYDAVRKLNEDYAIIVAERRKRNDNDYGWSKLPFIAELKQAMHGFDTDHRVHYPRRNEIDPSEGFKWFEANEKGPKVSLPSLTAGEQSTLEGL